MTAIGGGLYVGGLTGLNSGGVIMNSYAAVNVDTDADYIGGLVGYNNVGTITNSYALGDVNSTYSSGADGIGGLVGRTGGR